MAGIEQAATAAAGELAVFRQSWIASLAIRGSPPQPPASNALRSTSSPELPMAETAASEWHGLPLGDEGLQHVSRQEIDSGSSGGSVTETGTDGLARTAGRVERPAAAASWCVVASLPSRCGGSSRSLLQPRKRAKRGAEAEARREEPGTRLRAEAEAGRDADAPSYLQLLIADIDELNTIPFFDVALPGEIGILILRCLPLRDLCRCAQVSRAWNALTKDGTLWFRHALHYQLAAPGDMETSRDWAVYVRRRLRKQWELEQRWRELKAAFGELEAAPWRRGRGETCYITSVHCRGSTVLLGKSDGTLAAHEWHSRSEGRVATKFPSLLGDGAAITCLDQGQGYLVSGSVSGHLSVWTAANDSGDPRRVASVTFTPDEHEPPWDDGPGNAVIDACIFPSGATVAVNAREMLCFRPSTSDGNFFLGGSADEGWLPAWNRSVSGSIAQVVPLGDSCCCYRSVRGAEILDVANGHTLSTLHVGTESSSVCGHLAVCGGRVLLSTSEPMRHVVTLFDARYGAVSNVIDLPHAAACFDCQGNDLAIGDRTSGVTVFDVNSGLVAQRFRQQGRSLSVRSLRFDDIRVVCGGNEFARSGALHKCSVWDRRMTRQELWHIRSKLPVNSVHFTADKLVYSSCGAALPVAGSMWGTGAGVRGRNSCFVLDFDAPLSQLEDASCPFSSLYNDVSGYNPAIVLSTPFDNVVPGRLG